MIAIMVYLQMSSYWGLEFNISFGGTVSAYPTCRPTTSIYSNFSFVAEEIIGLKMNLGI